MSANNAAIVVRTLLANDGTVAGLVGGRIYPSEAPVEADLPLIVYTVRLNEAVDGSAPVSGAAVDVHCYAATDDAAQSLAVAADGALANKSGVYSGTIVHALLVEDWEDVRDSEMSIWGRMLRYGALVVRG